MIVKTAYNTVNYTRKDGAAWLGSILTEVKSIETVKHVEAVEVVRVSKAWRIFWIIFWILVFWPVAIIAYCVAGINKELTWTNGVYNVTLKYGNKFVLEGNEDFVVAFANEAATKNFLN